MYKKGINNYLSVFLGKQEEIGSLVINTQCGRCYDGSVHKCHREQKAWRKLKNS
jgi:hypothetical protein